jgi:hypothetical protein
LFKEKSIEGRKCWVYQNDDEIKALLMLKEEDEPIETSSQLPAGRRLKISTMKVSKRR